MSYKFDKRSKVLETEEMQKADLDVPLTDSVKNVLNSFAHNIIGKNVTVKCIGCMAPLSGQKGQVIRCRYCDTEQTL